MFVTLVDLVARSAILLWVVLAIGLGGIIALSWLAEHVEHYLRITPPRMILAQGLVIALAGLCVLDAFRLL